MSILILICAIVGVASLLGGALQAASGVVVALLKYVVGPAIIIFLILGCLKYGI